MGKSDYDHMFRHAKASHVTKHVLHVARKRIPSARASIPNVNFSTLFFRFSQLASARFLWKHSPNPSCKIGLIRLSGIQGAALQDLRKLDFTLSSLPLLGVLTAPGTM